LQYEQQCQSHPIQGPSTVWWIYDKHTEKILPVMGKHSH
jgi:hypothetical protein